MVKNLKYLRARDWLMLVISILFIVLQVRMDLAVPEYMSEITELVQTEGSTVNQILSTGGSMLLVSFLSVISSILVGFLAAQIGSSLGKELRFTLFSRVQEFSLEEMNRFSTPSLITRSTNDVSQVQGFIAMSLQMIVKAPILAISAMSKIAGKSWQWSALVGGTIVFLSIMIIVVVVVAIPRFKRVQELTDNINLVTRENLTGLRVVRAYNAEDYQEEKFEKASNELAENNLFASRVMAIMQPSLQVSMSAINVGVYWLGAYLINTAAQTERLGLFSDMIVFSSYAMQIISAFMMVSLLFIMLPRASVSARRVNEVLDTEPGIIDGGTDTSKESTKGKIEVKNVSFTYPDAEEYVLKDINFTANPGETVAFIGSTGSGKSTLINLIPRFYDVTEGEILIDGTNVKEYNLETLYNKIGYAPQQAVIFSGSIRSNIDFGKRGNGDMTEEDVLKSLEISQGMEFVQNMPGELDGAVAQAGTNLSGGQKQRLAIARAVARDAEILIFDDSFSALDYKTDQLVREALAEQTHGATTLIVAQRIGTIMDADQIIVLDEGNMVGIGKHKELLDTCQVYREIAESQLSEEELYSA